MGADVGQHFAGFLDEDVEQFGVDLFFAGREQLGGLFGRCGHRQGRFGDVFFVLDDVFLRGDLDRRRWRFREGRGFIGGGEFVRQGGRGEIGGDFGHGLVGQRGGGAGGYRGRRVLDGVLLAGQVMTFGAAAGEAVDVEAEGREQVGERLEQRRVGGLFGVGELGDHRLAVAQRVVGLGFAEQGQDAFDLLHRLAHGVQPVAFVGVAEEGVEGLLDLRQAGQHFLAQLLGGAAFLRGAGDRAGGVVGRHGLTARARFNSGDRVFDLGGEGGVGHAAGIERMVGQQQRRGDLHRYRVGEAHRVLAQPVGKGRQGGHQAHEGGAAELAAGAGQRAHPPFERGQGRGGAFDKLVPGVLGLVELVAQIGQQRGERQFADRRIGRRQQGGQLVQAVQRLDQRRGGWRARDDVHGVAVQAFRELLTAGQQTPDLGVEAAAQAADVGRDRDVTFGQHFAEGCGAEPEGARLLLALAGLDAGHGLAHHARAGGVVGLAHPAQQALLEADPHPAQEAQLFGRVEGVGGRAAWNPGAQIGVEQIAFGGRFDAARHCDAGVQLGQPQGLVGRAMGEFVEVVAGGGDAAPAHLGDFLGEWFFGLRQFAEELVEAVGELGQPVQPDDRQGAARLVQVRLRELQARAALVLVGDGLFDGRQRVRQRLVDFAFDPGEGAEIVFCGVGHECCLVARVGVDQTLKPDTEPFSSTARSASSPIDTAVCWVPRVVCSVIAWMPRIDSATWVALAA